MNHNKRLIASALLSAIFFGIAADKKDDLAKEETSKLQGMWRVTTFIDQSEMPAPADEIKGMSMEFKAGRITIRQRKDDKGQEFTFKLDPSKDPKWIDIDMGQMVSEGIYKLNDDELSLCVVGGKRSGKAAPRPKEFKARKQEKYTLFVLKKANR